MGMQLCWNDHQDGTFESLETLQDMFVQARQKMQELEARMIEQRRKWDEYLIKERQINQLLLNSLGNVSRN